MDNVEFQKQIDYYLCNLQQGDDQAMDYIYDYTHKQLYALCYSYFKNKEDSEDALFESYLKIKKEILKFKGNSGFAWMYTITKNICLNMIKKKKQLDIIDEDITDESTLYSNDNKGSMILEIAKELLNDHEFRILILHVIEGYKFKDIARITGKIEATVRWQYNNAIKKVKKEYENRYEKN